MGAKECLFRNRKKLLKTLTWRTIATSTTFCVALIVTGDASKSAAVAAVDTVLKTFFYYGHESCYEKAEQRNWPLCTDDQIAEERKEREGPQPLDRELVSRITSV